MRLLALTRYGRQGASSRIRFLQYQPHLERSGFDIVVQSFFSDDYLSRLYSGRKPQITSLVADYWRRMTILLDTRPFDLVWIEKEALPWLPVGFERIRNVPYVLDIDDAWYLRYSAHRNPLVRHVLGPKINCLMNGAALVTAGNRHLQAYAVAAGAQRVEFVPSVVDLDKYQVTPKSPGTRFTVAWIGSPSTERYLKQPDILEALTATLPPVNGRLLVIGVPGLDLPGIEVEAVPWDERNEARLLAQADVGIMPLTDTEWERGKCGFKLLQYMAAGIPVIAADIGANKDIVVEGTGFLVSSVADWTSALVHFRDNPDAALLMGQNAHHHLEQSYSLQRWHQPLARVLREVVACR